MLKVENLSAGYGDIIAVRDLSFSLERGQVLAFLGTVEHSAIYAACFFVPTRLGRVEQVLLESPGATSPHYPMVLRARVLKNLLLCSRKGRARLF